MKHRPGKLLSVPTDWSDDDRKRLERLAQLAGVTPQAMLPDVLEYGFEDSEESVQADLEAEEAFAAGRYIDHADVMAEGARIIEAAHAKRMRKA